MLQLESPLSIALMAVIAIILILYAVMLIKLKPTKEAKTSVDTHPKKGEIASNELKSPKGSEKPKVPIETRKIMKASALPIGAQKVPAKPAITVQNKAPIETGESQKKNKEKESKKSFFLFGESNFEGCPHNFGYLNGLPKSTPIPNECFGCPQIVDCLRDSKAK